METVSWQIVTSIPSLESGALHIWRYRLDSSTATTREAESLLDPLELQRASRFHFPVHRNRFVAGRSQLRKILAGYLRVPPKSVSLIYTQFGRPVLSPSADVLQITFNVSHSEDYWILAVAQTQFLGIDVERIREDFGGEDIARSNFALAEANELLALPESDRSQAFFNCWTRKEAYVKAMGAGLQIPLDSFEVTLRPTESARFRRGTSDDWNLLSFRPDEGYQAAVAYRGPLRRSRFFQLIS